MYNVLYNIAICFVTICGANRELFLGIMSMGEMKLSEIGNIVNKSNTNESVPSDHAIFMLISPGNPVFTNTLSVMMHRINE